MMPRERGTPSGALGARIGIVSAVLLLSGCLDNTAPGNDREAQLEPPFPPAPVVAVGAAIDGIDPGLLLPQIITDADGGQLSELASACRFRMTRVGFPVVIYGSSAIIKLNGRLVRLAEVDQKRYATDGVEVTIRPLDDRTSGQFASELVVRLPGATHELGFHGYTDC